MTYIHSPHEEHNQGGIEKLLENVCGKNSNLILWLMILTECLYPNNPEMWREKTLNFSQKNNLRFPSIQEIKNAKDMYQTWKMNKLSVYPSDPKNEKRVQEQYSHIINKWYTLFSHIIEEVAGMVVADKFRIDKTNGLIDSYRVYTTTAFDDYHGSCDLVVLVKKWNSTVVIGIDISISGSEYYIEKKQQSRSETKLLDFNNQVLNIPDQSIPRIVYNITPEQMQMHIGSVLKKLFHSYTPWSMPSYEDIVKTNMFRLLENNTDQTLKTIADEARGSIRDAIISEKRAWLIKRHDNIMERLSQSNQNL